MRSPTTILIMILASGTLCAGDKKTTLGVKAAPNGPSSIQRVEGWLKQFENQQTGDLPKTFCVRISLDGYLNRETAQGTHLYRPHEIYEFTPQEVRRLCSRVVGVDKDGSSKYRVDEKGQAVYEVAARKSFKKIDQVCRILLALHYLEMVNEDEEPSGKNFHHLQVMRDSGLPALGTATIEVTSAEVDVYYCETCLAAGAANSARSIRFAALYHTLRRLVRHELGLAQGDWNDALDIIDVDGSIKPM
ncbi:MAG: hypothetical protein ABGZ17_26765, partial [Planctomycetaceae bacterium]